MDWVDAIGFRLEAVHTGALRHLLGSDVAVDVARALTGDDQINRVGRPVTERRLRTGSRRKIDLAAEISSGGTPGWLGVEVKTDSVWSRNQLIETAGESGHGVLLAIGYTALAVDDRDMDAIGGDTWSWRVFRPGTFADVVREHAGDDDELLSYARHLAREAEDQHLAVRAVQDGNEVFRGDEPTALGHWAYFSEVIKHRDDPQRWDREKLISGPLMKRWIGGPSEALVQFVGEHGNHRSLCVKTWAPGGPLAKYRDELIERVEGVDWGWDRKEPRIPSRARNSCTAARFPLAGRTPEKAAAFVDELLSRLSDD
jgi:hypothetical protein